MNLDYNKVAFLTYVLALIVLEKCTLLLRVWWKNDLFIVGGKINWNSFLKDQFDNTSVFLDVMFDL